MIHLNRVKRLCYEPIKAEPLLGGTGPAVRQALRESRLTLSITGFAPFFIIFQQAVGRSHSG